MLKFLFVFVATLLSWQVYSQDTVTVMQYNLLFYGVNSDWCDPSNNDINDKDEYLKKIIHHNKPDIFTVNEIGNSQAIHQHLLDQVLNTNGVEFYAKANFLSVAESNLVNMLYYNSEKLMLKNHTIAQSYIRDINVYELYYRSDDLGNGDTAFIICVVGHLKSSSGSANENKRKVMAENTMDYLNQLDDNANYLLMGDFNLYSPTEPAYQAFLFYENPSLRFIDPIDQYGEWHNNDDYSHVHTQSTHANSNGCAASGGMDDRFDFVLTSQSIQDGSQFVSYIQDSYWAVGQDGLHFDKSINDLPTNTSVPNDVLSALYENSDHLPITLKLMVDKSLGVDDWQATGFHEIRIINPVDQQLTIGLDAKWRTQLIIEILELSGSLLFHEEFRVEKGNARIEIPTAHLNAGFYLIRFIDGNGKKVVRKIIKN